ncbi:MAG: hypothetical protein WBA83_00060 [Burkholderiaceae bacterium]
MRNAVRRHDASRLVAAAIKEQARQFHHVARRGGTFCTGPRGGTYCYSDSGKKSYVRK